MLHLLFVVWVFRAITHSWGATLGSTVATAPHLTPAKEFSSSPQGETPLYPKSFMIKIFNKQLATSQTRKTFEIYIRNWEV